MSVDPVFQNKKKRSMERNSSRECKKAACINLLYSAILAATFFIHCDGRRLIPQVSKEANHIKLTKHFNLATLLLQKETMDPSNSAPYVSSPFSLPPYDSLPPIQNAPADCIYPPNTPPITIPTPIGGPSPPSSYTLPGPPPPNPSSIIFSPPAPLPGPPITIPFVPNPPMFSPSVPTPPFYIPSPQMPVFSPPYYGSSPPTTIVPSPQMPVFSPPYYGPSPPTTIVPSPQMPVFSPPYYGPSPPSTIVPSPPSRSGLVPRPPVFEPPVVFPPPMVPPPPLRVSPSALWCVAKPAVPDPIMQEAMNYACGSGADCGSIQPSGSCYEPNSVFAHTSYAFNSYWQKTKAAGGSCSFGGTAILVTVDPSYDGCHFSYM